MCACVQVSSVCYARKDLEAYWEKKMKGLPMPELIKDLVLQNKPSAVSDSEGDLFVRDFDMKPNVIIYHSHVSSKMKNQPLEKKLEAEKFFKEEEDKLAQ